MLVLNLCFRAADYLIELESIGSSDAEYTSRRKVQKKLIALLKKFVTFMVLSQFFWCLTYIPFVPATPVQLVLSLWILLPNNEGEKVVYLAMSGYLTQFEVKATYVKYSFFA